MDKNSVILVLGVLALIVLVWHFTISVRIMNYLKARGEKVNPATMHFQIFDNASKYKQLTFNETGKIGNLYTPFLLSFAIFALILLSAILLVSS